MKEIKVRRYIDGDEIGICDLVKKDVLAENIKDYPKEAINHLIESHNEELIKKRAEMFHVYVLTDNEKIVGVGMIGPYWDSLTESSFFTIFIDPSYKGQGLGRKIIETLEQDEYYKRADRVEIPASITAVEFYKHFGYGFKKLGNIVDNEGIYRMEKYPKISKDNSNPDQYNMRPYIDNEHHNYKEFIYQLRKDNCRDYDKQNDERKSFEDFINDVHNDIWIIQLNGKDIGFYNGMRLEDGKYEIGNICLLSEYQGKGIEIQVLKDVIELHKDKDLYINDNSNVINDLCNELGLEQNENSESHYLLKKSK